MQFEYKNVGKNLTIFLTALQTASNKIVPYNYQLQVSVACTALQESSDWMQLATESHHSQ